LGSESLKNISNSTCIITHTHTHQKIFSLIQKQTPAYSVVRHYWNFKRDQVVWADEKNPYDSLHRWIFIVELVGIFFCQKSWTSFSDTWNQGFFQISTDKKKKIKT